MTDWLTNGQTEGAREEERGGVEGGWNCGPQWKRMLVALIISYKYRLHLPKINEWLIYATTSSSGKALAGLFHSLLCTSRMREDQPEGFTICWCMRWEYVSNLKDTRRAFIRQWQAKQQKHIKVAKNQDWVIQKFPLGLVADLTVKLPLLVAYHSWMSYPSPGSTMSLHLQDFHSV